MRYLLVLAIGLVGGWFGHELLRKPAPPRAPAQKPIVEAPPPATPPVSLPPAPTLPREEATAEAEEKVPASAATAPDAAMVALREMVQSQMPAWKAWAKMQTGQRVDALLATLPFDAERERMIKDLLQKEAERQVERAAAMMLGDEEMDPAAFQWFTGMPAELSPRLEGELATFLNDGEIQVLRAEVKRSHEKQLTDMADMQIGMMAIHDLSDDQKARMREVFVGKDVMTEQFTQFAEVVRDRDRMGRLLEGKGLKEEMEKGFEGTRRRVRDILNNEQFAKYQAYEKQLAAQAEVGLKMMRAFLERPREGTQEPASK